MTVHSVQDIWDKILVTLRNELSDTTIATWFDETEPVDVEEGTLLLFCPNEFKRGYIEQLFMDNIRAALKELFSRDIDVRVLNTEQYQSRGLKNVKQPKSFFESGEYTFETFVVGSSNQMAYAAAKAVAEQPAERYNPLFIYGDSGLGKTHLIYAIAHELRKKNPSLRIAYIKGDELTNELVTALQAGPQKTAEMREKYRKADLLLVDDVQFIAGKERTEEDFFHTFNALYEARKQIVLTSDRPPSEMVKLENRLQTRFEWGLLVDVQPPDFETRLAIVKNKCAQKGTEIDDDVAAYIAEKVTSNVRQLEGTVNKILAFRDLQGTDLDKDTVNRAIIDIVKSNNRYIPTVPIIIHACARFFEVTDEAILGKNRSANVVKARQIAMYLVQRMLDSSLNAIGVEFDRDHTTVMYSIATVKENIDKDPAYAASVREITTNINNRQ